MPLGRRQQSTVTSTQRVYPPLLVAYIRYMYIHSSGEFRFEWDPVKTTRNVRKHGVGFIEAQTVFVDEHGLLLDDLGPASDDQRFVILGLSSALRILVVVHSYRDADRSIRIVSARRATPRERAQYDAQFHR